MIIKTKNVNVGLHSKVACALCLRKAVLQVLISSHLQSNHSKLERGKLA